MEQSPFRLEALRALREHAEASAKHALAEELAVGAQRAEDVRLAEAALERARLATSGGSVLSGAQLAAHDAFVARRERERLLAQQWAVAQARRIAESRDALAQASKARSAFERLKEKHRAEQTAAFLRREQEELGEIALGRHLRAQS